MFKPEDFQLSLEKQLKLRVIFDDIDNCNEKEILKESLKSTAEQLLKYQQLLAVTLEEVLTKELESWDIKSS